MISLRYVSQQENKMYEILMVIYLVVAIALIAFILIQQGKGGGMGSAFGSGASGTVFGAGGSGTFLTKTTTILAIIFFGVALGLGNLTSDKSSTTEENSLFPGEATEQAADTNELPVDTTESDLPETATADPEAAQSEVAGDLPVATDEKAKEEDDSDKDDSK
jgi:preprotein translocase subunit SecG